MGKNLYQQLSHQFTNILKKRRSWEWTKIIIVVRETITITTCIMKKCFFFSHNNHNGAETPSFLLCTCRRGEGIVSPYDHVCRIITKDENLNLYENFKQRFYAHCEFFNANGKTYTVPDHMKWVDKHNCGWSCFGIYPWLMPRNIIYFDTFHLKFAITRKLNDINKVYFFFWIKGINRHVLFTSLERFGGWLSPLCLE